MTKNTKYPLYPTVSICTPTFNRRPFIPMMIKCFEHQTYPKDKIEWIIVDDGTDKIEELVSHIPQVKYFKFDEKMTLGKKRNLLNEKTSGEIIIYMDDDDYYPPQRISHAVETLCKNPKALCAGSSAMFIYFKHINKMFKFGPYGPNHATAATFAFKRELLKQTKFDENNSIAEEKHFLKNYTIPFVQLDINKSILVFSHNHNSFDKKILLSQEKSPFMHDSDVKPMDFIKNQEILNFFMEDIDNLLNLYEHGNPINKPDVTKQMDEIKKSHEKKKLEYNEKQNKYHNIMNKHDLSKDQKQLSDQAFIIQQLTIENEQLNDKIKYLDNKLKEFIAIRIQEKKNQLLQTQDQII
jgi:glycosyltransferase involved in cell wall biosynthesis